MNKKKIALAILLMAPILSPIFSNAQDQVPIYFSADEVEEDSKTGVITARGDVNIARENITLKADTISYDRKNDVLVADGNVSVMHPDGTVVFSDHAQLSEKMTKATINEVKAILADQSRLAAKRIKQTSEKDKHFFYAVYSPCDVCKDNPKPLWSIKARKITHDVSSKNIYYRSATLNIKDVPVLYTPFLSHPDPSVKRRSGFMPPSLASNNYLGTAIELRYFFDINDHEDLLLTPILSTDQNVVFGGRYRKMLYNGELRLSFSSWP
ncbi:MAG: LPS-assembly protein LptD, partial [Alphaproteobacteria bacterium]|nr:LPS-assembly protein LptD [Alphaproteobacteria bacterium]